MSREEGTITKVADDKAWVRTRRSSMCEGCKSQGVCHSLGGTENMETEAINTAGAKEGDRVVLEIASGSLWKISFIFYMIPVFFLIAGVIAGLKIGKNYSAEPELFSFLCGVLACFVAYSIIKLIAKVLEKNKAYIPKVIKII
ncbi:MAG: SoxR reducing system RseC family protein [bacterium]|nr:SoxR reducing system RseC family protein [bacterium]